MPDPVPESTQTVDSAGEEAAFGHPIAKVHRHACIWVRKKGEGVLGFQSRGLTYSFQYPRFRDLARDNKIRSTSSGLEI